VETRPPAEEWGGARVPLQGPGTLAAGVLVAVFSCCAGASSPSRGAVSVRTAFTPMVPLLSARKKHASGTTTTAAQSPTESDTPSCDAPQCGGTFTRVHLQHPMNIRGEVLKRYQPGFPRIERRLWRVCIRREGFANRKASSCWFWPTRIERSSAVESLPRHRQGTAAHCHPNQGPLSPTPGLEHVREV